MDTYIPSTYGVDTQTTETSYVSPSIRGGIPGVSTTNFLSAGRALGGIKANNKIVNGLDDPSHLGFNFVIVRNYLNSGLFGGLKQDDNTVRITDVGYSALRYLWDCVSHDIGVQGGEVLTDDYGNPIYDTDENGEFSEIITEKYVGLSNEGNQIFLNEYKNLKAFVDGFTDITKVHPYVFQTIEGLQDAYKRYFANAKDAYLGGGEENKIKITCLESMDLRMLALFDAYFNAVYDHGYRRQILPPNLLKFDCGVLVHDIRNIAPGVWNSKSGNGFKIDDAMARLIAENVSSVWFEFKDCVFDTEEIGESFANVSNAEANETGFSFVIRYSNVNIRVNSLADAIEAGRGFDANKTTDGWRVYENEKSLSANQTKRIGDSVSESTGTNVLQGLLNFGQDVFNSATTNSKLGNVYEDSVNGLVSSALAAVTGASASTIINGLASQGMHYLGDKIMDNIPSGPMNNFIGNMTNGMRFNF